MAHTLKIGGDTPVVPGLALPAAFEALDKRLESTLQLCQLKSSAESQTLGLVTVCQELQRLLKFAFIENGMLASRIEILTRYHNDTVKKMEKRMAQVEVEHRVTRKQMKRMRKRLYSHEKLQQKKHGEWWDVQVSSSDYDSLVTLSQGKRAIKRQPYSEPFTLREAAFLSFGTNAVLNTDPDSCPPEVKPRPMKTIYRSIPSGGNPDLEFMLRVNQIMIDFVNDKGKTELLLPPMGSEERQELAKLASIYKLRCRFGKSMQVASSILIKARQASIPAAGEVDAVLESFTKAQKRLIAEESSGSGEKQDSPTPKDPQTAKPNESPQPEAHVPPTMLTPLSSLASPTVDISGATATPSQSPPTSGLTSPTETVKKQLPGSVGGGGGGVSSKTQEKGVVGAMTSENPLPAATTNSGLTKMRVDTRKQPTTVASDNPVSSSSSSSLLHRTSQTSTTPKSPPLILSSSGHHYHHSTPLFASTTAASSSKHSGTVTGSTPNILVHHHGQVHPLGHPTVVASPLKMPLTQLPLTSHSPGASSSEGKREMEGKKETEGKREAPASSIAGGPAKRLRITRRSASCSTEDEHSKL